MRGLLPEPGRVEDLRASSVRQGYSRPLSQMHLSRSCDADGQFKAKCPKTVDPGRPQLSLHAKKHAARQFNSYVNLPTPHLLWCGLSLPLTYAVQAPRVEALHRSDCNSQASMPTARNQALLNVWLSSNPSTNPNLRPNSVTREPRSQFSKTQIRQPMGPVSVD